MLTDDEVDLMWTGVRPLPDSSLSAFNLSQLQIRNHV
jgi:glycerol-3-phosphate dehydrogenase